MWFSVSSSNYECGHFSNMHYCDSLYTVGGIGGLSICVYMWAGQSGNNAWRSRRSVPLWQPPRWIIPAASHQTFGGSACLTQTYHSQGQCSAYDDLSPMSFVDLSAVNCTVVYINYRVITRHQSDCLFIIRKWLYYYCIHLFKFVTTIHEF